jgi:hypothetical protein
MEAVKVEGSTSRNDKASFRIETAAVGTKRPSFITV